MVLLAASICNKQGKALVSRQFVEMTRARIEGLLLAFPKLIASGPPLEHTYVDTESVRYVYQPLEKFYMILITTKASNILEDLETLRLFARVIPEYCTPTDENSIIEKAFDLIFAFDEIVALGYRENVNLGQIRTFTTMDSHEERVFQAVRETQEREAKENMKRKARELQRARREAAKHGGSKSLMMPGGIGGGGGSDSSYPTRVFASSGEPAAVGPSAHSASRATAVRSSAGGRAMKLGGKTRDADSFVNQLKAEGEQVIDANRGGSIVGSTSAGGSSGPSSRRVAEEPVHIRMEEKLQLSATRDGGLRSMELFGIMLVRVASEDVGLVRMKVSADGVARRGGQVQTHPNIDKRLFQSSAVIQLKNPSKPFPAGQDLGVLKWRLQTTDESNIPLTINCWPNESGAGCDVNIEYELMDPELELNDVIITIPLPHGTVGAPRVSECEGEYRYDPRTSSLEWSLPVIDASNRSGAMEFSVSGGNADAFFPVTVSFASDRSYCGVTVESACHPESGEVIKFSQDTAFFPEKYEFVD